MTVLYKNAQWMLKANRSKTALWWDQARREYRTPKMNNSKRGSHVWFKSGSQQTTTSTTTKTTTTTTIQRKQKQNKTTTNPPNNSNNNNNNNSNNNNNNKKTNKTKQIKTQQTKTRNDNKNQKPKTNSNKIMCYVVALPTNTHNDSPSGDSAKDESSLIWPQTFILFSQGIFLPPGRLWRRQERHFCNPIRVSAIPLAFPTTTMLPGHFQ